MLGVLVDRRLATILAFTAGYLDTATFVGADGLFSAHVTGNFVLFAAKLVTEMTETDYLKLISFLFFIFSNAVTTYLFLRGFKNKPSASHALFILEAVLIILCGVGFPIISHYDGSQEILSTYSLLLMTLVFALGIQNATPKLDGSKGPLTTVMTGNVTQLATDIAHLFLKNANPGAEKKDSLIKTLSVVLGFSLGCILAAYATTAWGLVSILVPGLLLLGFLTLLKM